MLAQDTCDLVLAAQPFGLDVPLHPVIGNGLKAVRLDRRGLEGGLPVLDALDRLTSFVAGLVNGEKVRRADRRPYLLAGWRARHRDEAFRTRRSDADIMTAQLGVGHRETFARRLQLQYHVVCEGLASGHFRLRLILG